MNYTQQKKQTKDYLNGLKTLFFKVQHQSLNNRAKYLKGKGISLDESWENNQNYLFQVDKMNYFHHTELENGCVPIFLTLTLPSEYHRLTSLKHGGYIFNSRYNSDLTINRGYKHLVDMFRTLYNKFNYYDSDLKKVVNCPLKYSRVIEPHKDFTPHLHAILYIPKDLVKKFIIHFNNLVLKNKLEQTDIKILDAEPYAISYLLKYVSKTIHNSDITDFDRILKGWKQINKIVVFRTSNAPFNRLHYTLFKSKVDFNPAYLTYFHQMLKECKVISSCYIAPNSFSRSQFFDNISLINHVIDSKFPIKHKVYNESLGDPLYIINHSSLRYETPHTSYDELIVDNDFMGFISHGSSIYIDDEVFFTTFDPLHLDVSRSYSFIDYFDSRVIKTETVLDLSFHIN